jgi:hypothetical protein
VIRNSEISKKDCEIIAKKIRENIFKPALTFKTTIFLCGADLSKKSTIRYKIAQILSNNFWYSLSFDLVYPEDIFEELLYGSSTIDLLSLENLLADSVDAVIIIPESPGSFTELGAFAGNEKLRNKLICVIDEKYKRDKSFINQGPLKLVKNSNKDNIVYINPAEIGRTSARFSGYLSTLNNDKEVEKILTSLRKLKKSTRKNENKISLLQLDRFLLPAIFLLEPVIRPTLIEIVSSAIDDSTHSSNSTITALTILTKKRFIELTTNGYILTELGTKEFLSFRKQHSRTKQQDKTVSIDELRLEILNLKNRRKKLKV